MISCYTFSYSVFIRHEDTDEQRDRAEHSAWERFLDDAESDPRLINVEVDPVQDATPTMIAIDLIEADAFDAGVLLVRKDLK